MSTAFGYLAGFEGLLERLDQIVDLSRREPVNAAFIGELADRARSGLRGPGWLFPVTPAQTRAQGERSGPSPRWIPWSVAEKAYSVYAARYGRDQSLERIADRGGFYAEELDELHPSWRDEASEITALRAQLADKERIDPEQTLSMHLIQQLKQDCQCAVCQVLREHCEEAFSDESGVGGGLV